MHQALFLAALLEMLGKFTAIVSLNPPGGKQGDFKELIKEITATGRGVRFIGISEGKPGADINGGKDIALKTISEDRNGIHLNEIAGLPG